MPLWPTGNGQKKDGKVDMGYEVNLFIVSH